MRPNWNFAFLLPPVLLPRMEVVPLIQYFLENVSSSIRKLTWQIYVSFELLKWTTKWQCPLLGRGQNLQQGSRRRKYMNLNINVKKCLPWYLLHLIVQYAGASEVLGSASKVLLWSITILIHGIMKVMKVTLHCVSSWCLHCCTNIILTNDKLHLIQTTISHILRASGQSLHSYKDDDYHYYLVQMTHIWPIPCSYKIIFFVMFDNVSTH